MANMLDGIFGIQQAMLNGEALTPIRRTLNFTGPVTAEDDPANDRTNIIFEPFPTDGAELGLIYEVAFAGLASQAFSTVGAKTIDGLQWYLKGLFTGLPFGTVNATALINGTGLRLSGDFGQLDNGGAGANDQFLRWFLPLASIPNCNPNAPIVVRARMVCSNPSDSGGMIGLISTASNGTQVQAADRATEIYCGPPFSAATTQMRRKAGASAESNVSSRGVTLSNQGASFVGVGQLLPGYAETGCQVWAGSIPAISGFTPQNTSPQATVSARTNPGVIFAMTCNGGSTKNTDLTHLSIYQPKV